MEDPFPQVQHDVRTAWNSLKSQQQQQQSSSSSSSSSSSLSRNEHLSRLDTLEQDVNDLRVALDIARSDPQRFKLSHDDISKRSKFIDEMTFALTTERQRLLSSSNSQQEQEMILREQDENLDDLANAVQRIGNLGRDMHAELESQGEILDTLGGRFDGTIARMKAVRQRVDRVIQQTGRKQFCTIIWLSIAFLILTILVVTT